MALADVASLVVACAICYGVYEMVMYHVRRRRLYKMASNLPGPPALPFIGNAHLFLGSSEDILHKIFELIKLYPSPFRVWLGPRLIVSVADPEQIKTVCLDSTTLGRGNEFVEFGQPMLGEGLLTAPVSRWKTHRKLIQPTFNAKILNSFVKVFAAQSEILAEQMASNLDGPEIEIFGLVSLCTLDMICETAMGVNVGAQTNRNHQYVEALNTTISSVCARIFSIWLYPDVLFNLSRLGKEQRKSIKFLHNFTNNVIQMKKNEVRKRSSQSESNSSEDDPRKSGPRREVFLDHLMKLPCVGGSGNFSDKVLREEVDTMVLAGNETTANTTSFAMLMLASHPEMQDKVYQELHEIYGDENIEERPVTAEDLPHMKYLERVIKETLRLFPVVPVLMRAATEDLALGDHIVPRGSSIFIGVHRLHRNEKYWPDPLKFDPDRFLPEEVAKRHPYAYMPFSGGPRNCLGINYAMMSMKTLLATILRRYVLKKDNIVPVKDIRLTMELVLKPADPIKIRIERRSRK